jgi:lysophospholipase L1-like esterase
MRNAARALGAGVAALCTLLAFQVRTARRRDYLREGPGDAVDGPSDSTTGELHLVVIGDSTAVGVGAGSVNGSYPAIVAQAIREHRPVRLTVLGRSGLRWGHVPELASQAVTLKPSIVAIGVGGNDAIHLTPLSRVRTDVVAALDVFADSGIRVLIVLGPRFDAPAVARPLRDVIARRCRAVNRAISAAAKTKGIAAIDTESVIGDAFARDPKRLYSVDLFHPSAAGYVLWAGAFQEQLLQAALERA